MIRSPTSVGLRVRLSPTVARARIGASVLRLAASRDRASRAIGRALRSTALESMSPEEREWVERIESRRQELLLQRTITEPVFGPPPPDSRAFWWPIYKPVSVDAAAGVMSLPTLWCGLLMRLVRELAPRSCLELGTAFGISGAYQAAALELNGAGRLITLDGARQWAEIANQGFSKLGLERVETLIGPIADTFGRATRSGPFDFAFVDAEHTEEAIVEYLDMMLPHLSDGAVLVLDDIGVNRGMWRAWRAIRRHDRVSLSLGLGRIGVAAVSSPDVPRRDGENGAPWR